MQFWRTYNNKIYPLFEVKSGEMGFPSSDPSYIPDEYLEKQNFIILRTCFGIGDWGIISAFPKKLKEKYPNCKVYIPSIKLLEQMFGELSSMWSSWESPYNVVHTIFDNNPYVDGFIDSFEGDVFNDHYRVYNFREEVPLLEQIMRFWQFDNFDDIEPEIYWSEKERELGDKIIEYHCKGEFGTLLISNNFKNENLDKIQDKIAEFNLPMFYWLKTPNIELNFKKALDLRNIDVRIQLYIKSKAKFNVGNQCGVNDTISNYAPTYTVPRISSKENNFCPLGTDIIKSQHYI